MKTIELTQGKKAIVDDRYHDRLTTMGSWCLFVGNYAAKRSKKSDPWPDLSHLYMHRVILEWEGLLEDGKEVDHIDGNGLNNQLENLRVVTHQQNAFNRKPNAETSSQYKGVYYQKVSKKWQAHIKDANRLRYIGLYANEADAARAYNEVARELYGEYARLNEIVDDKKQ